MIWLTWRQHRMTALVGTLLLFVSSFFLIYDIYTMLPLIEKMRSFNCFDDSAETIDACIALVATYHEQPVHDLIAGSFSFFAYIAVLLVGIFIGAPLVAREQEQFTHRLIWTQGITRSHWLLMKLGLIACATLLVFALLSILMDYWWNTSMFQPRIWNFFHSGIFVFPAYALIGLVLGVLSSILIRRIIPAMTVTFILLNLTLLVGTTFLNNYMQYIVPPKAMIVPASSKDALMVWSPERLIFDEFYADRNGNKLEDIYKYCNLKIITDIHGNYDGDKLLQCEREKQIQWKFLYYPIEYFLPIQGVFASFLIMLSLLLTGISFWWLRRRIS